MLSVYKVLILIPGSIYSYPHNLIQNQQVSPHYVLLSFIPSTTCSMPPITWSLEENMQQQKRASSTLSHSTKINTLTYAILKMTHNWELYHLFFQNLSHPYLPKYFCFPITKSLRVPGKFAFSYIFINKHILNN